MVGLGPCAQTRYKGGGSLSQRILLAGYFGCGNLGDDAILVGLKDALANDDVDLATLSANPAESYSLYGIRAIPRKDFKRIDEELKECQALVFPGGSIFQDVTSSRSAAYYASLVQRAKRAGKKVVFLGQGVGPLNSFLGRRFAASSFKAADAIVVRDPGSASLLRSLGVNRPIEVAADMAFLMPPPGERPGDVEGGRRPRRYRSPWCRRSR